VKQASEPSPTTPTPAVTPSKGRKILRRTLSGARLVGGLALILWLASRTAGGEPIQIAVALVLALAVWETARMGRFRELPLLHVLPAPLLALLALHAAELVAAERARTERLLPEALSAAWRTDLPASIACAALLAVAFLGLRRIDRRGIALGLGYAALAAGVVALLRAPLDAWAVARAGALATAIVAVACLPRLLWTAAARAELGGVLLLAVWLLPPLLCLGWIWRAWGTGGLVALLLLSKIGDTAGYYFGSWLGRTHPFPRISPGKTTAGCVASLVTATVAGGVAVATGLLPEGRWALAGGLAAGAALNVAAQAGDLFESWLKRRAEVKDSSTWFGPSGGLLDQLDSLLFSVPVAVTLFPILFPK
jgi:phosphatidate cytidylyltransferase